MGKNDTGQSKESKILTHRRREREGERNSERADNRRVFLIYLFEIQHPVKGYSFQVFCGVEPIAFALLSLYCSFSLVLLEQILAEQIVIYIEFWSIREIK